MKFSLIVFLAFFNFQNVDAKVLVKNIQTNKNPVTKNPLTSLPTAWTASNCIELGCHFSCEVEADGKTCKPNGVFKCDCGGGWVKVGGCTGY
jgi:hypothetical protein